MQWRPVRGEPVEPRTGAAGLPKSRESLTDNDVLDIRPALRGRLLLTGHTDNLETRVAQHVAGEIPGYTSTRRPVTLVFSQETATREAALASERQIKGWSRTKKEAMMRGDRAEVSRLARAYSVRPSTGSGRTEEA
jgi:predicted GIY-YIG superfamily endonuclease